MDRPLINPGSLFWTGQHWVNYLRVPGTETDSGMVSLWHTDYCAAGEGTMAYVSVPGPSGCEGIFTNNLAVTDFIRVWMGGRGELYDRQLEVRGATFHRVGDIRRTPTWIIETDSDQIIATWDALQAPVLLDGPAPKFMKGRDVQSLLFFADAARLLLNGHLIPGVPYLRGNWKPTIGGERSSCFVALSETFIEVKV